MPSNHIPENLRLLTSYGKSVSEICRQSGVNRTQFNRYLNGQSQPTLQSLRRICDFFGVDETELLLEPDSFKQIIRIRPPKLDRSPDPALRFVQDLFGNQNNAEQLSGYYHNYFQPEADIPHIYCNLARLDWTGQSLAIKIIERHTQSAINLPDRLVYRGAGFVRAGKLFCFVQEQKLRRSTWFTVLSLGDFVMPGLLNGITTGTEPEGGNAVASFKTIWKHLGQNPDLRDALQQCGCFDRDEIDLPFVIKSAISPN